MISDPYEFEMQRATPRLTGHAGPATGYDWLPNE